MKLKKGTKVVTKDGETGTFDGWGPRKLEPWWGFVRLESGEVRWIPTSQLSRRSD
jgi:hypothetical protein